MVGRQQWSDKGSEKAREEAQCHAREKEILGVSHGGPETLFITACLGPRNMREVMLVMIRERIGMISTEANACGVVGGYHENSFGAADFEEDCGCSAF